MVLPFSFTLDFYVLHYMASFFVRLIVLVIGFFPIQQLFADPSISSTIEHYSTGFDFSIMT